MEPKDVQNILRQQEIKTEQRVLFPESSWHPKLAATSLSVAADSEFETGQKAIEIWAINQKEKIQYAKANINSKQLHHHSSLAYDTKQ